jgi:ABC-type Zn uptake system ZnuABC Zn-binding protein ZnuA
MGRPERGPRRGPRAGSASFASLVALALAVAVAAGGCSALEVAGRTPTPSGTIRVVTTTTVFADLVRQVGGGRVDVTSLVPKGGEVHTFDPAPSAARAIADADLIVMNGLGLDDWLARLATNVGTSAPILRLGEDLPGVTYLHVDGGDTGPVNPHLWMNVALAQRYVERIRDKLIALLPAARLELLSAADAYLTKLGALDATVRAEFAAVPAANRRVVSFHDAFPYYASAYGLTVVGTVVRAPGQEPSAGEVGALVSVIRAESVKAILAEAQFSDAVVRTISDETGAAVVSELYTDSLGDPPVDTYIALIRWDTTRILTALG